MTQHQDILRELDAYAKAVGIDTSTVCRKATGNPRLHERLARRLQSLSRDAERLRKFMVENPPVKPGSGQSLACPEQVGTSAPRCKGEKA